MADILVVDDEANVNLILKHLLNREGYRCLTAQNADQARKHLEKQFFELLICDISMPGENGMSLVADVRRRYPDIACVFLSGVDDPETTQEAIDLGVYGFILKPFSPKTLLITIANALHRRQLELENRDYRENLEKQVTERTCKLQEMIQQLQETRDELTRSREEYRHLVTSLPIVVYRGYLDWSVDFVGDKIEEVTGYSKKDFESRKLKWCDLILEEDFERTRTATIQAAKKRSSFLREYRVHHRDGHTIWIQDRGQPIYDENGFMTYVHGVALDVTEQRQAEEQLRLAREEMQLLLDSISGLLISIDGSNRVQRWNSVATAILGIPAAAALGKPIEECRIPWDWKTIEQGISECRRKNAALRIDDVRFEHTDGKPGFLGITVNPIDNGENHTLGILFMAADITERKLLESQLNQAQKLESIGQLAAGIAHEINTPTQYVGDNIRFLKDSFQDLFDLIEKYQALSQAASAGSVDAEVIEEIESLLEEIDLDYLKEEIPKAVVQSIDGVERVAKIVLAMKEFSHPGTEEKKLVDINKAIESTITVSRNEWKYVAEMNTDFDSELGLVPCLASELNQVFLNIIVNAAHAIADTISSEENGKGAITATTRSVGKWCEIRFSDNSGGIPEEIKHRIFDPFLPPRRSAGGPAKVSPSPMTWS